MGNDVSGIPDIDLCSYFSDEYDVKFDSRFQERDALSRGKRLSSNRTGPIEFRADGNGSGRVEILMAPIVMSVHAFEDL